MTAEDNQELSRRRTRRRAKSEREIAAAEFFDEAMSGDDAGPDEPWYRQSGPLFPEAFPDAPPVVPAADTSDAPSVPSTDDLWAPSPADSPMADDEERPQPGLAWQPAEGAEPPLISFESDVPLIPRAEPPASSPGDHDDPDSVEESDEAGDAGIELSESFEEPWDASEESVQIGQTEATEDGHLADAEPAGVHWGAEDAEDSFAAEEDSSTAEADVERDEAAEPTEAAAGDDIDDIEVSSTVLDESVADADDIEVSSAAQDEGVADLEVTPAALDEDVADLGVTPAALEDDPDEQRPEAVAVDEEARSDGAAAEAEVTEPPPDIDAPSRDVVAVGETTPAAPTTGPPSVIPIRGYYLTRSHDTLRSVAAQFLNAPERWAQLRSINAAMPGVAESGPDELLAEGTAIALPGEPLAWGSPDPVYLWTLAETFLYTAWGREPTPEEVVPFWRGLAAGGAPESREIGAELPGIESPVDLPPAFEMPPITAPEQQHVASDDAPTPSDEPDIDEPVVDAAEVDEPDLVEADLAEPDIDEPVVDAVEVDEPDLVEADLAEPDIDEPVVDAAEVDEPDLVEADLAEPDIDEPVVDAAEVDEPDLVEADLAEPDIDEPVVDAVEVDEPDLVEADLAEPDIDEPVVDEPVLEAADGDESALDEPDLEEPDTGETLGEPVAEESDAALDAEEPAEPVEPIAEDADADAVTESVEFAEPDAEDADEGHVDDGAVYGFGASTEIQEEVEAEPESGLGVDDEVYVDDEAYVDDEVYVDDEAYVDDEVYVVESEADGDFVAGDNLEHVVEGEVEPGGEPMPVAEPAESLPYEPPPPDGPSHYEPPPQFPPHDPPPPQFPPHDPPPPDDSPPRYSPQQGASQQPLSTVLEAPPALPQQLPPPSQPPWPPPPPPQPTAADPSMTPPHTAGYESAHQLPPVDPHVPQFLPSVMGVTPSAAPPSAPRSGLLGRSLAGTAVGDAMLLWQIGRRRRQGGARTAGMDEAEQALRQTAGSESLHLIETAMRHLQAVTVAYGIAAPAVLAVRVGSFGFEVLLERPVEAPPGWRSASGGYVLELPRGTTARDLGAVGLGPSLCPALVPVGNTLEGPLLLNLAQISSLAVSGPNDPALALVSAITTALSSSPMAQDLRITAVGMDAMEGALGWERVSFVAYDTPAFERLLSAIEDGTSSGSGPEVVMVGPGHDLLIQRMSQAATRPGSSLSLVAATSAVGTRWPWSIHVDSTATAVVYPISITMTAAQALPPELIAQAAYPGSAGPGPTGM